MNDKFSEEAQKLCKALKTLVADDDALDNFESYLRIHFDKWLEFIDGNVNNFVEEVYMFAHMYDGER